MTAFLVVLVGVNHSFVLQYNVLKLRGDTNWKDFRRRRKTYILGPFLIQLINNNNTAKDTQIVTKVMNEPSVRRSATAEHKRAHRALFSSWLLRNDDMFW
jgi:hypothetical protein